MNRMTPFLKRWEFALLVLLVAEIFVFGAMNQGFLNAANLLYSTNDFAHILIVAIPLTLVIITGGIDISVGSMMGLSSIVFGLLWKFCGFPIWAAFVGALATGTTAGLLNGLLVASTDINPIVLTLGTMFLYQGLATGFSGSTGASGYNGIGGFPESFTNISYGAAGGVPYALVFCVIFSIAVTVLLTRTALGRAYYLIGVNRSAALLSGIRVRISTITTYAITGLGAAIAGLFLTAYFTSSRSDLGKDALMPTITAVVLGGTNINGGSGTVFGTFIAAVFLGYMKQGLMALGVTSDVSQLTVGFILITTVVLKEITARVSQRNLTRAALRRVSVSPPGPAPGRPGRR
jgi:AI-2 transport system permease protein